MFKNFMKDESGQGMVEYGLIIALIAVVVIVALKTLGGSIGGIFTGAAGELDDALGGEAPAEGAQG